MICESLKRKIKDTGLLYDDVSSGLVKHHLVEHVHDLTNKFIVLLLGCKNKAKARDEDSCERRKGFP